MKLFRKNLKKEICVIAEIGNNHEGNLNLAYKMIREAKRSGADAVKFQMMDPEYIVKKIKEKKRFKKLKKFLFSIEQFKKLKLYSKKIGIEFFITPFDLINVKKINKLQNTFKISSGDNNFFPLIEKVLQTKKKVIISTGLAKFSEIKKLKNYVYKIWKKNKVSHKLILLHCVSDYPVKHSEANLKSILYLKKNLNDCIIGYSDHTLGIEGCLAAAAMGARVIEKHFTLNKNLSSFRDHKLSATPEEMKTLTTYVKTINVMLGNEEKKLSKGEQKNQKSLRRSITISKNLPKNQKITIEHLNWLRNTKGIPPGKENIFINKRLKIKLNKGDTLKKSHV